MDKATRNDRLKTLDQNIRRGDSLTEVEEAQLAELEVKGSRIHGRGLSKMGVTDMDGTARANRRLLLRKMMHHSMQLDYQERKQDVNLGLFDA